MENNNEENLKYLRAKKTVKKIKGFYIHALVYALINLILFFLVLQKSNEVEMHDAWGVGLWGIGLLAHGFSVFLPNFFLGSEWEERKIRELIEKDKH